VSNGRDITAVLLAAGVGRRMGSAEPKSFLSLTGQPDGPTFLDRHIALLRSSGVAEILVVLSEAVAQATTIDGATVVVNPFDTRATGSTLSLLCALETADVDRAHDLLVADADIVYERQLLDWIVDRSDRSAVFVTPNTAGDDEEVAVYSDPEGPRLIGKGLPPGVTDDLVLDGESLGIMSLAATDRPFFRAAARWLAGWPPSPAYGYAKERSEHEELWQYGFTVGKMSAIVVPSQFLFAECDTPEDYRHVCERHYPAIQARDGPGSSR
jgi:choline kinase